MFRKIQPFDLNYPFGMKLTLPQFFKLNETRDITPYDGTISEVIVDGYVTNILIESWNMYQIDDDAEIMSLRELEKRFPKAEILWIAKKN
jgi:hypothetical protein